MTEKEALWTGVALSLFVHFLLVFAPERETPSRPAFRTELRMDMESPAVAVRENSGVGVIAARPRDAEDARTADRKRKAFLDYLDALDEAVHARRLDSGDTDLIGVATYTFTVRPDGSFTEPELRVSSGNPRLDASALRAIRAAGGKVRRPALVGTAPIPVILQVKYQYGLR